MQQDTIIIRQVELAAALEVPLARLVQPPRVRHDARGAAAAIGVMLNSRGLAPSGFPLRLFSSLS